MKKYHKAACTSLPEDEHLDVRNMSKTYLMKKKCAVFLVFITYV